MNRLVSVVGAGQGRRRLRICETLSLGEKRFIAVVEYDRQKFLLAGTPQTISLLQRLEEDVRDTEVPSQSEVGLRQCR